MMLTMLPVLLFLIFLVAVSGASELQICIPDIENLAIRRIGTKKQLPRGCLRKRCSENMQQIYRRTHLPKNDSNKVVLQLHQNCTSTWIFSCKFASYFRTPFPKNTFGWLFLNTLTTDFSNVFM